jgi:hypothetical protein
MCFRAPGISGRHVFTASSISVDGTVCQSDLATLALHDHSFDAAKQKSAGFG